MLEVFGVLLAAIVIVALLCGVVGGAVYMVMDMVEFYRSRREDRTTLMPLKEFIVIYQLNPEKWALKNDGAHGEVISGHHIRYVYVAFRLRDYFGYKMFLISEYLREGREMEKAGEEIRGLILDDAQAEIEKMRAKSEKEAAPGQQKSVSGKRDKYNV